MRLASGLAGAVNRTWRFRAGFRRRGLERSKACSGFSEQQNIFPNCTAVPCRVLNGCTEDGESQRQSNFVLLFQMIRSKLDPFLANAKSALKIIYLAFRFEIKHPIKRRSVTGSNLNRLEWIAAVARKRGLAVWQVPQEN